MSEGAVDPGTPAVPDATPAAPTGVAPVGDVAVSESSWTDGLNDDDRAFVETKGWKDNESVIKSYRNIERLRGVSADKLTRIPDWDNGEEVAEFQKKIGVPDGPEGYEPMTATSSAGELDVSELDTVAHSLGLTPNQRKGLLSMAVDMVDGANARQSEQVAATNEAGMLELHREWGSAKAENEILAEKARSRFGINADAQTALQAGLGQAGAERLMARIGRALGEHKGGGDNEDNAPPEGMTRRYAKEKLAALTKDKENFKKMQAGDVAAKKQWSDLNRIAFGEK